MSVRDASRRADRSLLLTGVRERDLRLLYCEWVERSVCVRSLVLAWKLL